MRRRQLKWLWARLKKLSLLQVTPRRKVSRQLPLHLLAAREGGLRAALSPAATIAALRTFY